MKQRFLDAFRNWVPEMEMTLKVKFINKKNEQPVTGNEYTVRLYDRELLGDDNYLGHAQLNEKGEAHIHFYPADVRGHGLGLESLPDLYILLFKGDRVHFQTKVWDNVDFDKLGLLDIKEGEVVNFGTFVID
ncbi:MAG TPA: hypothetical protein VG603_03780 [Chitinophagales bacterium]|nr:hypothetical protein [Chitinophagales bacterium]